MSDGGDSAEFAFVSRWELSADRQMVWDALVDFHQWPVWWPALEKVIETIHGDEDGIGQKADAVWRGPLGYTLKMSIEAVEKVQPEYLRGAASGDVDGEGVWRLGEVGGDRGESLWTTIEMDWNVRATKRWMVAMAPVARPAFVAGHDHVMKKGAEGLADYLTCEIRNFSASVA